MVSLSGSVGYTLTGKTATWTDVKTSFMRRGSQKRSLLEKLVVHALKIFIVSGKKYSCRTVCTSNMENCRPVRTI